MNDILADKKQLELEIEILINKFEMKYQFCVVDDVTIDTKTTCCSENGTPIAYDRKISTMIKIKESL